MSYLSGFGPTSFSISVVNDGRARCIQLVAQTTPPNGTYTLFIGHPPNPGECSATSDFTARGTVVLDQNGRVQSLAPLPGADGAPIGGHDWKRMSGTFNSDGTTGTGGIGDDTNSDIISGVWSAGGGGEPFGHQHEHKHGQHA